MRPLLATDRLSWLLTYISFVVDHRWTFRSTIDIAINHIHIGRRIFSVNHSGAWCLQPCNPEYIGISTHARHATLCPGTRGISKHQNTGEFRRNCRVEYGIVTWRYIAMWNSTHFDLFSSEDWYIFCEQYRSVLSTIPTPPVHRRKNDSAPCILAAMCFIWDSRACETCYIVYRQKAWHFKTSEFCQDRNAKYAIVTRRTIHNYAKKY